MEIAAIQLQMTLDLKRHNYTVGETWCFWASCTAGAVAAWSESMGLAGGTAGAAVG